MILLCWYINPSENKNSNVDKIKGVLRPVQLLNYINVSSTTIERFIIIIYVQRIQRASGGCELIFVKFNKAYHIILISALTISEVRYAILYCTERPAVFWGQHVYFSNKNDGSRKVIKCNFMFWFYFIKL